VSAYEQSDDLKYEVVVSANEDVTGVHELWWIANTWWPDVSLSVRLRRAEDAIVWALERDLIALYYDATAEGRRVAPHEWPEVLRDWRTWAIPDGPRVFFWRTDAGEEWLRRKPLPRSWWVRAWNETEFPGGVEHPDLS
jgi:hypothetical protein